MAYVHITSVLIISFHNTLRYIGNLSCIIMQCDVKSRINIFKLNKVKYLNKKERYKNSTKDVIFVILSDLCNAINKTLTEIRVIGTLTKSL